MSTDFHSFWQTYTIRNLQTGVYANNPPNSFCVTALSCKILISILVVFFTAKTTLFYQSCVVVLFFTYLHESSLKFKIFTLTYVPIVNMTEVVIKILQGSAVTEIG